MLPTPWDVQGLFNTQQGEKTPEHEQPGPDEEEDPEGEGQDDPHETGRGCRSPPPLLHFREFLPDDGEQKDQEKPAQEIVMGNPEEEEGIGLAPDSGHDFG
jgi:hypothetical protein